MTGHPRRAAMSVARALGALGAIGLVAGALQLLTQRGALMVHQCVGVGDGAAGWLGLRFALLRQDAACPSGSLAVGPDGRQALAVVVVVALPVLVAHLVAATVGVGLAERVRQIVGAALRLLVRPLRGRPGRPPFLPRPLRLTAARPAVRAPGPVDVLVPLRRGPPLRFA